MPVPDSPATSSTTAEQHAPQLWTELQRPSNLLSLVRIPLGMLAWLAPTNSLFIMSLLVAAGISDMADGWLARRAHLPPENMGAWLDPLCDKLFSISVLVAVWLTHDAPVWLALLAVLREFVLLPLFVAKFAVERLRSRRFPFRAKLLGKLTTVFQFVLFMSVLFNWKDAAPWFALASGLFGVVAGVQYTLRAVESLAEQLPPREN